MLKSNKLLFCSYYKCHNNKKMYCNTLNTQALGLVVLEKKIFKCFSHYKPMANNDVPGAWPIWTPGSRLAGIITRPSSPVRQVRRAPDHFFDRICYCRITFFAVSAASVVLTCDLIQYKISF